VVAFDERHKLADKWEEDPYLMISQHNQDIHVYKVQREDDVGRVRILHRNVLLPIGNVSKFKPKANSKDKKSLVQMQKPKPKPQTRQQKREESDTQSTAETFYIRTMRKQYLGGSGRNTRSYFDAPTLVFPE
jgi:hypothetical protein